MGFLIAVALGVLVAAALSGSNSTPEYPIVVVQHAPAHPAGPGCLPLVFLAVAAFAVLFLLTA